MTNALNNEHWLLRKNVITLFSSWNDKFSVTQKYHEEINTCSII